MLDRRTLVAAGAILAATPALAAPKRPNRKFPKGFLWGAATAGHQVEGNNVNSDSWLLENLNPTVFAEPSGDAANSFALWTRDLDLVKHMGLNSYRFSLEWARIEPEPGLFSIAMLNHYRAIIEGCRSRGLTPVVTFNHFTTPRWFAADGGWTNPKAPARFALFCQVAARHLASGIGYAVTLNEPNIPALLRAVLPASTIEGTGPMLRAAARACGTKKFASANIFIAQDIDPMTEQMIAGHKAARAAIKTVRPDLPVGLSLAMYDDQAVGKDSVRDTMRVEIYGPWLDAVKGDDFMGVQNYERALWDAKGKLPAPEGATVNYTGSEVYAPSLAGAVRFAHAATGLPIIVTEHGVGIDDDTVRAALIPAALKDLKLVMDEERVPVLGYIHWSLLDNFEWGFGYRAKFGLVSVDRTSFVRTPKPSAKILGSIAARNSL